MGSDNLHHKRKAKKAGSSRTKAKEYPQILVVSEDSKSSVTYLKALWRDLSKHKVQALQKSVQIHPSHKGSSPDQVLESAKDIHNKENDFTEIYCVMDVDSHQTLNTALSNVRDGELKACGYHAIVSNPCFEYWVYLHLVDSDAPFNRTGKKSVCDCVGKKIREISGFEQYNKGNFDLFKNLSKVTDAQNNAIDRSKRILGENNPEDKNPSTNFHVLIERLIEQSSQ